MTTGAARVWFCSTGQQPSCLEASTGDFSYLIPRSLSLLITHHTYQADPSKRFEFYFVKRRELE
jgi:hypothetical protein